MKEVNVFSNSIKSGNKAGVVDLKTSKGLTDKQMQDIATVAGFSETVFVIAIEHKEELEIHLRYFTPTDEVPFCGHATLGALHILKNEGVILTKSAKVVNSERQVFKATFIDEIIFIEIDNCKIIRHLSEEERTLLYSAFGVSPSLELPYLPTIVESGLRDILLPFESVTQLNNLKIDFKAVASLSQFHHVVGVHAFCMDAQNEIHCRNFAPLFGINEECATGTSNCGLTNYLYTQGFIKAEKLNRIIQGEKMNNRCEVFTIQSANGKAVRVGGSAIVV